MFEVAEIGRKLSREEFDRREPAVHAALLEAQRQVGEQGFPVIVIVSGVEGAGKGAVVSLLHRWMDVRGLETHAFWEETDEDRMRPRYWRFWQALPPRGRIGILFGSWYTLPIVERALRRSERDRFDRQLERIRQFEDMLVDDGALIVKLWFHLSKRAQRKRLEAEESREGSPIAKAYAKRYDRFRKVSERALRKTDVGHAPWHVIEAADPQYRDLRVGEILLERIRARLASAHGGRPAAPSPTLLAAGEPGVLAAVRAPQPLAEDEYRRQLDRCRQKLFELAWRAHAEKINTVAVFEGWDAAGKGGAIRRVTQAMDARLYRVISVAAPTDEEKAQHYLWRFWRHIPRAGYHTIYDRSWYGRVLVERVEGYAAPHEWQRAYNEINAFEEQLADHGTCVLKFWLHIDQEEQLRRFREREQTPWKRHKIGPEDWRNRARWADYEHAVNDMVAHTSTEIAPWTLVPANDKRQARLLVLETYCEVLAAALR